MARVGSIHPSLTLTYPRFPTCDQRTQFFSGDRPFSSLPCLVGPRIKVRACMCQILSLGLSESGEPLRTGIRATTADKDLTPSYAAEESFSGTG
jgi:hypothetical protein